MIYHNFLAMLKKRLLVALFSLGFIVTSCKDDEVAPNSLTANAGPDQQGEIGAHITLDGSASSDSEKKTFSFKWALTKRPTGSAALLTTSDTEKTTFIPDEAGEYEAELTISNANGTSRDKVFITASAAEPLVLDGAITVKTVLKNRISNPNLPDYVVKKNISVTSELTIDPGVVIAFARDTRLDINDGGILIAKGTADKKIGFRGVERGKGYWAGIVHRSTSNANELEYAELTDAGSKPLISTIKTGFALLGNNAQISLKQNLFANNDGFGLHAERGTSFRSFDTNTFKNNSEAPVLLDGDLVKTLDENSTFTSGNGRNVIEIFQSTLSATATTETVWKGFKDHTPYRIVGNLSVNGAWKLLPGTTIEVARDLVISIENKAYLSAKGTKESKIVIKGVQANQGYWRGMISYSASAENILEYVEISGGGSIPIVSGKKANIAVYGSNARMDIKTSSISNSGGYGIFANYQAKVNADIETSNTFKDNSDGNFLKEK